MSFHPPTRGQKTAPTLTRRQKAAVVVHLLVSGGADPGLRDLPPVQQRQLVRDMAALRFIDRETLASVIAEFAQELDSIGLHIPRDPARILALLETQLSDDVVDELVAELGDDVVPGHGPWDKVAALDVDVLVSLVESESDEVSAILLSKLPATRAADLLRLLPAERSDQIAAAFARTDGVAPMAVAQIGMALGRETGSQKEPAFASDGVKRVGDILNASTSGLRRTVLDALDASNPDFAARVRSVVFSFENIPDRIAPRDMPRVLRGVDNTLIVVALAGLTPDQAHVGEFILSTISNRMADQLREDAAEREKPTEDEIENATGAIVSVIRQMEESGDLTLTIPDEAPPQVG